jgi:hypothetical protein
MLPGLAPHAKTRVGARAKNPGVGPVCFAPRLNDMRTQHLVYVDATWSRHLLTFLWYC